MKLTWEQFTQFMDVLATSNLLFDNGQMSVDDVTELTRHEGEILLGILGVTTVIKNDEIPFVSLS